jgi:hypothetical protein
MIAEHVDDLLAERVILDVIRDWETSDEVGPSHKEAKPVAVEVDKETFEKAPKLPNGGDPVSGRVPSRHPDASRPAPTAGSVYGDRVDAGFIPLRADLIR